MILSSVMRLRLVAALVVLALPIFGSEPLTVTAPADGTVLRGGSVATIAWTATEELPRDVVEWEAFLSVDGGRYYSTRITPHLDIDIREFEWRVPNVSSNDVRLLIRIGDEREEKSVDVPLRLTIVADLDVRPSFTPLATGRGESARPGDPGVAEWATGDRGGREVGHRRAPVEDNVRGAKNTNPSRQHAAAEAPLVATPRTSLAITSAIAAARAPRASSLLLARDILVLVRRRNI